MILKRSLLTTAIVVSTMLMFSFASAQDQLLASQSKAAKPASAQVENLPSKGAQLETLQKRLGEINATINDLERKSEAIASQRSNLEAERAKLLTAIAREDAEQEFRSSPGYLVVGVSNELSVTLLMHGHEKNFRLFGLYVPSRHSEAVSFLKRELAGGRAYVRCEDPACNWGFLYVNRESVSLNRRMVEEGIATAQEGLSLEDRLKEPVQISPPPSPAPTPSGSTNITTQPAASGGSTIGTTKQQPGTEVHVKGYTRKDGTYVPPHTRSAPRRKP